MRYEGIDDAPSFPRPAGGQRASLASRASADAGADRPGSLDAAIKRIVELVDYETAALRSSIPIDLADVNAKKSHALHELTSALRPFAGGGLSEAALAALESLRHKLGANREVLEKHLAAAREVSMIVVAALRDAESDGTYSGVFNPGGIRQ